MEDKEYLITPNLPANALNLVKLSPFQVLDYFITDEHCHDILIMYKW